jgi:hypothetical protein
MAGLMTGVCVIVSAIIIGCFEIFVGLLKVKGRRRRR